MYGNYYNIILLSQLKEMREHFMTNKQANIILGSIIGVSLAIALVLSLMVVEKEHPGCYKYYALYAANSLFPNNKNLRVKLYDTMVEYGYMDEDAAKIIGAFMDDSEKKDTDTSDQIPQPIQYQSDTATIQDENAASDFSSGSYEEEQTDYISKPIQSEPTTPDAVQPDSIEPDPVEEAAPEASTTLGQENALGKAHQYLDTLPLSYQGLVQQLEYDGFSNDEAIFAADNCGADWNDQAAKKASDYLNMMNFSRSGLIEQLEYDGFTADQAEYATSTVGY